MAKPILVVRVPRSVLISREKFEELKHYFNY